MRIPKSVIHNKRLSQAQHSCMKNQSTVLRVILTCAFLISGTLGAAPVATTDESVEASRAPRAVSLSGGTASAGKSSTREESKTIDLLIDLQDKAASKAPDSRNSSALPEGRPARATSAGSDAGQVNKAAAAYFGVPVAATARSAQNTERTDSEPSSIRSQMAVNAKGAQTPAAGSTGFGWLPRGLLFWVREHRYEILAAVFGTLALMWVGSAALARRRH